MYFNYKDVQKGTICRLEWNFVATFGGRRESVSLRLVVKDTV